MSANAPLSVRVPLHIRRWLERLGKWRGNAGMAASRILEETRRREDYPAIEFRDTPPGRFAYVQGTRVQAVLFTGNCSALLDENLRAFDRSPLLFILANHRSHRTLIF